MMFIKTMRHDNENNDTWTSLAAVTAKVLDTDKHQDENPTKDRDARNDREDYVAQRLRDTAAFERRAGGKKN